MVVVAAMTVGGLVDMIVYGTLAVQILRFLVAVTGFASLFLGWTILVSPVALPKSWLFRVVVMIVICVVLWISLSYVEESVVATIVQGKRQGYAIANIPDLVNLLGLEGTFDLVYVALAVVAAVVASLMTIIAQIHMLLSAHAASTFDRQGGRWRVSDPGGHDDWRIRMLASMGNRSGFRVFIPMIMMTLLCLGLASDWLIQMLDR